MEARCHIRKKTCGRASHVKKKSCSRASVFTMFVVTRCSKRHVRESSGGMESDLLPLFDVTILTMTSLKKYYFFYKWCFATPPSSKPSFQIHRTRRSYMESDAYSTKRERLVPPTMHFVGCLAVSAGPVRVRPPDLRSTGKKLVRTTSAISWTSS